MNPKHTNPTRADRTARAPYNFVPLPEKIVLVEESSIPKHDRYDKDKRTGYIDCTLETLTPVYTRTALDPDFFTRWADNLRGIMKDEEARKTYGQFFRLDDANRPVIPGSSLRGMVRSLVEIVGYGKVQWVNNKQLFFRTMGDSSVGKYYAKRMMGKVECGFLRKRGNEYYIKKCEIARIDRRKLGGESNIYRGAPPNQVPKWEGKPCQHIPVWVALSGNRTIVDRLEYVSQEGMQEGRLIITGNIRKKKREFVFLLPEKGSEEIPVPYAHTELFHDEDQITQWQEKAFPKDRPQSNCRQRDGELLKDNFLQGEGDPVFFLRDNEKLVFFGRAQMFRLPYEKSQLDFVPEHLRGQGIDLAEAIFGYIAASGTSTGHAGRVYFTDAVCEQNQADIWYSPEPRTPDILSSPKPTAFQHYLVQDKSKKHDPDIEKQLAHYGTPTPKETVIRGHKLYWHKQNFAWKEGDINWLVDTQHTQIRPVRKGVKFHFRIYFENLTDFELGALLWVLDLPEGHRHKIGMGKPLGLGSVAIKPCLVLTDRCSRYQQLFDDNGWYTGESSEKDFARFKRAFEEFILNNMLREERGSAKALRDIPRIQALLKMLQFPGPSSSTDYMVINEFENHPVLPDPLNVSLNPAASSLQAGSKSFNRD